MFRKYHYSDRNAPRRVRFSHHVRDVFSVMTPDGRDDLVEFAAFYIAAATLGLVCSLLGWSTLSASSTVVGVLLVTGISLVLGPLVVVFWFALVGVGIVVAEFVSDETESSRETCRDLRRSTRRLRRALRAGGSTLEGFTEKRAIYRSHAGTADLRGPWSRLRARRVERLRSRLRTRLLDTYDSSLDGILDRYRAARNLTSGEPLDATPMVWTCTPPPQSIAALRVLETHAPLTGCITENRRLVAGTTLLFAPKWVYDVVNHLESARASADPLGYWMLMPSSRLPAARVAQCVALEGADPETVTKLFEPHGDGPFTDLAEVVRAARLV